MITPFYAALLSLFFVVLSFRTLLLRRKHGISIGTGEEQSLERAVAVHSNFAEYVPLAIILIYFLENSGVSVNTIHTLSVVLLIGRLLHAYGLSRINEKLGFRVVGMVLTFGVIISSSMRLLVKSIA